MPLTARARVGVLLAALPLTLALSKRASAEPEAPTPAAPAGGTNALGHAGQFGLRMGVTFPYKVLFRFDDSPPCSGPGESPKVCGFASTTGIDLAASFALFDAFEPFLWGRFGLGADTATNTAAQQILGAGARFYTRNKQFKLFFEAAAGLETEGSDKPAPNVNYETDLLFRLNFGGQYDFSRYIGGYASVGPSVSFVRAITAQFEGTVGLQLRAP